MKQEDKKLLLKDLCARLPYGVKVESVFINPDTKEHKSCGIEVFDATNILMIRDGLGEFKPYLFPLSSITEKQKRDLTSLFKCCIIIKQYEVHFPNYEDNNMDNWMEVWTWCYKNHIDIYGLIPMGLAIDATGLNIY